MLERLSDNTLRYLLERGKKSRGAAPFLRPPRGMILLREEGYRRGIDPVTELAVATKVYEKFDV